MRQLTSPPIGIAPTVTDEQRFLDELLKAQMDLMKRSKETALAAVVTSCDGFPIVKVSGDPSACHDDAVGGQLGLSVKLGETGIRGQLVAKLGRSFSGNTGFAGQGMSAPVPASNVPGATGLGIGAESVTQSVDLDIGSISEMARSPVGPGEPTSDWTSGDPGADAMGARIYALDAAPLRMSVGSVGYWFDIKLGSPVSYPAPKFPISVGDSIFLSRGNNFTDGSAGFVCLAGALTSHGDTVGIAAHADFQSTAWILRGGGAAISPDRKFLAIPYHRGEDTIGVVRDCVFIWEVNMPDNLDVTYDYQLIYSHFRGFGIWNGGVAFAVGSKAFFPGAPDYVHNKCMAWDKEGNLYVSILWVNDLADDDAVIRTVLPPYTAVTGEKAEFGIGWNKPATPIEASPDGLYIATGWHQGGAGAVSIWEAPIVTESPTKNLFASGAAVGHALRGITGSFTFGQISQTIFAVFGAAAGTCWLLVWQKGGDAWGGDPEVIELPLPAGENAWVSVAPDERMVAISGVSGGVTNRLQLVEPPYTAADATITQKTLSSALDEWFEFDKLHTYANWSEHPKVTARVMSTTVVSGGLESTIRLTYSSSAAAYAVRLRLPVPPGSSLISTTNGGTFDSATATVYWWIGDVAAAGTGYVECVVRRV